MDSLLSAVELSRVKAAWLGWASAPTLGRFEIRRRIGSGGQGMVFEGHDPELGRSVAIKVAKADDETDRHHGHEARALAAVSHPNVVGAYAAGADRGRRYLVMQHISGERLSTWAPGQPWRRCLEALCSAGSGVAALHAAGLVHGDVKPDNVVVGADGRGRVVDLGLSVTVDGRGGPRGATEGYRAPELTRGQRPSVLSDQWAFAVMADAALERAPSRVRRVVRRARHSEPARRWPSMAALVAALEDRARPRARPLWLVAPALAVSALLWTPPREETTPNCDLEHDIVPAATLHELHLGFQRASPAAAAAVWPQARIGLETFAREWAARHAQLCSARKSARHDGQTLDASQRCLDAARRELGTVIDTLAQATPTVATRAAEVVGTLRELSRCDTETIAESAPVEVEDPAMTDAFVMAISGRVVEALERGRAVVSAARPLGETLAAAHRAEVLGKIAAGAGQFGEAKAAFLDAYFGAIRWHDPQLAAEAAIYLCDTLGTRLGDDEAGNRWARHAAAALDGLHDVALLRARLASCRANLASRNGLEDHAATILAEGLDAVRSVPGARATFIRAGLRSDLAIIDAAAGRWAAAEEGFQRGHATLVQAFGPEHPTTLNAQLNLAMLYLDQGRTADAVGLAQQILDGLVTMLPADHPAIERARRILSEAARERIVD